jgi:hypothetical protein
MDVDVDSVEAELNVYTRVQEVPLDTDPLMWWKQHVQEFPRLPRMTRQHLAVPATSASPERQHPELNLKERNWNDTHTHSPGHTHTYHCVTDTHLSLSLTPTSI